MNKSKILLIFICLSLMLVACGGDGDDATDLPELPTRASTLSQDQPQVEATTVEQSVDDSAVTEVVPPTATRAAQRTLPPTFTPTLAPTETLTSTPQPTATQPEVQIDAPPEACATFGPDLALSTSEVNLGQPVTLAWTPVSGATLYRIVIIEDDGTPLFLDPPYVAETSFTIPAENFTEGGRFAWDVEPLDAVGVQMCLGRGDGFIVN